MREYKVEQICEVVSGGTPSTVVPSYWSDEVVWLTPKDLSANTKRYITDSATRISRSGLAHSSAKLVPQNTVLLSSRAPIGYLAIAGTELCTNQGFKSLICDTSAVSPEYLYYLLKTKVEELNTISTGSTFKELSTTTLKNHKINVHSLTEQRHIVDILGSLDDKVEANEIVMGKIDELIRQKYSHFIQFSDKTTWKTCKIGEVTSCILGGTPSREKPEYWNGNVPWINSGKINEFRIIEPSEFITEIGLKRSNTQLIPKNSVVLAITGATLGQVSILGIDTCANQSVVAVLENEHLPTSFLYPMICAQIQNIVNLQTGGAQQHINKGNIENFSIELPCKAALTQYQNDVEPLQDKILSLCFENQQLQRLKQQYLKKFFN
jgi:type I restriction enzyme S subunit